MAKRTMKETQSKQYLRELILSSLLGSVLGFLSFAFYHASLDLHWTALMAPYKFSLDSLRLYGHDSEEQITKMQSEFHALSAKASGLAILKAFAEDGFTGAIIGGALSLAIAITIKRERARKDAY
ncbi:MAG: hypothetical protein DKT66_16745 [Candidatus Melainabacteria bacterium]|nr:MAG: hypothetical protein DKT66_16745 [Candidatus Melainabacteria bacterium]